MAYRKTKRRTRKQNPSSGATTALLLGGVGLAGYLAYINGWFGSFTLAAPAPAPVQTTGTNNPVTNPNTTIVNAPSAPPPLGTVVTNGNDVTAQATAGYAYILPGSGINTSTAPNGYSVLNTTDYGPIFLRNNVYQVAYQDIANRMQRATSQGAAATSIQAAGNETLAQIQQAMSSNGIAGLRGLRGWN